MVEDRGEISTIRDASRRIVRELGFMRQTLAGTDLSPSAVHTLIEIGGAGRLSAHGLAALLRLDKSSVSRLLARLRARGLVAEQESLEDGRAKSLHLTAEGMELLARINHFAGERVQQALNPLTRARRSQVAAGLAAYASALESSSGHPAAAPSVEIVSGMLPGALGRIVEMHGRYYSRQWGFGAFFEAKVAQGLAEFIPRLDRPENGLWLVVQGGEIRGSAAIDGQDLGSGRAHLRWVIIDDGMRGLGIGRRLLEQATGFCDRHGMAEIQLWTFRGLDAARALYEGAGFVLAREYEGDQWGRPLTEQMFIRRVKGSV